MITIALLNFFTNYCLSKEVNDTSSMWEVDTTLITNDSVKVSYEDLRKVNVKLIDLKYTKEENTMLRSIIQNDSIIIYNYETVTNNLMKATANLKKQRNIGFGVGAASIILGVLVNILK